MRVLMADLGETVDVEHLGSGAVLEDEALAGLYAAPPGRWVRANFATSIDGSITGADGRSGTVNSEADHVVFDLLRALSDVVVVGAGTLRAEKYGPLTISTRWAAARARAGIGDALPLVAVTSSGQVPPKLLSAAEGAVLLVTHATSPGLASARRQLGEDQVLLCGEDAVDPSRMLDLLADRGLDSVVCEGGPHLLGSMLAAGVVDEICHSTTPIAVSGNGPRMTAGAGVEARFLPRLVVEEAGTLMSRWVAEDVDRHTKH